MRINVARRGSSLWQASAELARHRYWHDYGARINASPDCFIALCADSADTRELTPLACAGLTYGGESPLLIENYLGRSATSILAERTQQTYEPADLVEVGPLASAQPGAGVDLIRMLPALCWCNGASHLLCTMTSSLVQVVRNIGIDFTVLAAAHQDALPQDQQGRWGTYYETSPVAGYVDLRAFDATINRQATPGYDLSLTWKNGQNIQSGQEEALT